MSFLHASRVFTTSPRTLRWSASGLWAAFAQRSYAQMPPRRKFEDSEIEESFLKGSGPGGQKINKTNSAVQLKHLPTGVVVKSQATRSRTRNREIARRLLGEKLETLELGDQARVAVKAAAKSRKKASADKKKRRKYRKLEEEEEDKQQEGREEEAQRLQQQQQQQQQHPDSPRDNGLIAEDIAKDRGDFVEDKSRNKDST